MTVTASCYCQADMIPFVEGMVEAFRTWFNQDGK